MLSANHIKIDKIMMCFLMLIFFVGCSGDLKSTKKDPFFEKWDTMADNSQGHSPEAKPKKIDVMTSQSKEAQKSAIIEETSKKLPTKSINLTMRQADLKAVLRAMAKSVDCNLLVKNDLKGDVSVDFRSVPWDQAFTGLLKTHGLSYMWEGKIIRVMTIEDIEQELKQKVQMREIQLLSPLITVVVPIDFAIDDEAPASAPSGSTGSTDPKTNKGKLLRENLETLLSTSKDGKKHGSIRLDPNSNALIITAIEEDFIKIKKVIDVIDKPRPQILIKANIVEASKSVARDLGIKWGGYRDVSVGNDSLIVTGGKGVPTGGVGGKGFGANFPAGSAGAGILDAATGPLGTLGLMFGVIGGNLLEVELQALQKDSKIHIVSSPSITTLDNQKAYTENGKKVPFVTLTPSPTPGGVPTQTVTFQDAVMRLEITPRVIDGKNLKMKILVSKDELDFSRSANMNGNPIIVKKLTETTLVVKNGETIVISGLTKETSDGGNAGLPGLKDVPILGWAVKADSRSEVMEEVLIFITPTILQTASVEK
ncbi:MAG: type IV pilus assembly protein PilQ [Syntrophaceae bacterium]|nr:MAG: type IV pilus assembly protein PilQ [Syntrophaceae bacterium]